MADQDKPLTGVRKRQQIDNANKQMMITVAVAAAVVTVCVVLGINFVQRIIYGTKVNSALSSTAKTLDTNVNTSIKKLISNVDTLQANKNLLALRVDPNDEAVQVILDALPTVDDRVALGASLQDKILAPSGIQIESISIDQGTTATTDTSSADDTSGASSDASVKPTAQTIEFSLNVTGAYDQVQEFLRDLEKTIRPITVTSIRLEGTDDKLTAAVSATTYYSPRVKYALGSKEIQP
jgi:hypothetical protein